MKIKPKNNKKCTEKRIKKFPRIQWRNDSIKLNKKFSYANFRPEKTPILNLLRSKQKFHH